MPSIVLLRRLAQSTTSLRSVDHAEDRPQPAAIARASRERSGTIPIAWREAKTKASAAKASALRYGFIAVGLIGALVLVYLFASLEAPTKINISMRNRMIGTIVS